ncbi:MAG: 1-acylglycerol-3-phosphate O-acyltransferase [Shewanella sp.]|uniref:1-acylglycerol-3-phosphate O-acyltransferase n=1 Tax=Shewanella sp. SNU WT4 TaxID=2590015 RepID=UPI00112BFE39|nr:1-acylglycerol-3-phosphate O-acyltransferase [Shewanella sp. SNU WT4]QDF65957.1 1-acylglycerol-3-phosphate O-acyltransferase [Shewanella sp. SNU WT4]
MLLIIRSIMLAVMLLLAFIFGGLYCVVKPRHRDNVHMFAKLFSFAAPVLGIKVIVRQAPALADQPCIYVANHQNNFDMFTHTAVVPTGTVSLGKKSIVWMPLFGQIYWLSGNILIDRNNRQKAFDTMAQTVEQIKQKGLSVWIFPEGTRSRGRGILPFKSGAFHTAIAAGVPIVPVVASCQSDIRMNRWNNGVVIIEALAPVETKDLDKSDVKALVADVHQAMADKFIELSDEAKRMS